MHVAIVENTRITHHGQVGVALHEAAARIETFHPWRDGRLPEAGGFDALVVFGGEQAATDDATHPWLPALGRLMAQEAREGRAVLGICLGAQILARGMGARNLIGTAPEFGWCEIARTGADDPVLGALPDRFHAFQWHSDSFTLPEGSVHLAASARVVPQCFRVGRAGYGMQFHFEASRAVVADWQRRFPETIERMAPGWSDRASELAAREGALADAQGLALARAWVAQV
jgi:GMP synthase-like glutamine amidotransferase